MFTQTAGLLPQGRQVRQASGHLLAQLFEHFRGRGEAKAVRRRPPRLRAVHDVVVERLDVIRDHVAREKFEARRDEVDVAFQLGAAGARAYRPRETLAGGLVVVDDANVAQAEVVGAEEPQPRRVRGIVDNQVPRRLDDGNLRRVVRFDLDPEMGGGRGAPRRRRLQTINAGAAHDEFPGVEIAIPRQLFADLVRRLQLHRVGPLDLNLQPDRSARKCPDVALAGRQRPGRQPRVGGRRDRDAKFAERRRRHNRYPKTPTLLGARDDVVTKILGAGLNGRRESPQASKVHRRSAYGAAPLHHDGPLAREVPPQRRLDGHRRAHAYANVARRHGGDQAAARRGGPSQSR